MSIYTNKITLKLNLLLYKYKTAIKNKKLGYLLNMKCVENKEIVGKNPLISLFAHILDLRFLSPYRVPMYHTANLCSGYIPTWFMHFKLTIDNIHLY